MTLMKENVCGGHIAKYALAYVSACTIFFAKFLAVCAISKLPSKKTHLLKRG